MADASKPASRNSELAARLRELAQDDRLNRFEQQYFAGEARRLEVAVSEQQKVTTVTEVVCGPDNKPASGYCAINGCAVMSGHAKLCERN